MTGRSAKHGAAAVSLKTIAREAGVAPSTVSRTFTRPDLISRDTRDRVHSVAERLGYQPNVLARSLATGKTLALGVLVPDITNPFFPPLVRAVEDRAYERGYALLLMDADETPSREQSLIQDHASRVDGLILCAPRSPAVEVRKMASRLPVVLINRPISGVPSVLCETTAGYESLIEHLAAIGHRRLVYVAGPRASWADQERRNSLRTALARRRSKMTLDIIGPVPATYQGGMTAAESVVSAGYTAVLAFDDITALGVLRKLWLLGCRVPDDIVVAGCDNIEPGQISHPPLTSIATPIARAARTAVDLLIDGMENPDEARIETIRLAGRVVFRESTGPVPGTENGSSLSDAAGATRPLRIDRVFSEGKTGTGGGLRTPDGVRDT